jgi:trehalose 6-phosphate synthase
MRVRPVGPALVNPGEPDEYGTWTAERLESWLRASTRREPVVVLSHHGPAQPHDTPGRSGLNDLDLAGQLGAASSGLVGAVEPLIRACSGVWVAQGSDTDVHATDQQPYRVRRVSVDDEEERASYYGFANEALWPLCHRVHVKPVFRPDDFTTYWNVNARFAAAVCEEAAGESPLVFVQDHHFALAPQLVRERLPHSRIITFWHIPWPNWQTFEICPWRQYLLEGLLGSSIIGFQTPLDCRNFIETVERCLGAHVDRYQDALTYQGRQILVRSYPTSVRWPNWWATCSPAVDICRTSIRRQLGIGDDVRVGVGVDRLDHTKGVEEKFLAIERLLECYPEYRERFTFAQLAAPIVGSRPAHADVRARVLAVRDRVNARFGTPDCTPIRLLEDDHAQAHINLFFRAADFCYVGSLHEGMNLVAKEFVSARDDERGVLVLSAFAGAARELTDALSVNPYDVDDAASVLARALTMNDEEQADRMRRMRSVVAEFSAWRWAAHILSDAARLRRER